MSEIEICIDRCATDGKIIVDGHDIAEAVSGFRIDARVGQITKVELDLVVIDATTFESPHVQLNLAPRVADYLERAGWTPPPGQRSVLDRDEDGCPCEKKDVGWPSDDPDKQEKVLGRTVPTCPVHGVER